MRILITNDDGIKAPQLLPLAKWAQKLGQVVVAAPKNEQSGKSHSIELHKGFEVLKLELAQGIEAYSVDSTPADCVRFVVLGLKEKFDLVISGINRGLNIGSDIIYSGTVSAASEAVALGLPALAVSTTPEYYASALSHMDEIFDFIHRNELMEKHNIYNINIPADPIGFRITRQGGPYYSDDFALEGGSIYSPQGKEVFAESGTMDFDTDAVLCGGYISITPITIDRTDLEIYHRLEKLN